MTIANDRASTLCAFCPKLCRFSCPISESQAREALTPQSKMSLLYLSARGESLGPVDAQNRVLEACTGCDACTRYCAHDNPVGETLASARGKRKTERSIALRSSFLSSGDAKGRSAEVSADAQSIASGPIGYFPGCTRIFEEPNKLGDDIKVLQKAYGPDFGMCALPTGQHCCGYPLLADGAVDAWRQHISGIARALQPYEVIVTPDPGCAHTLSELAKKHAPEFRLPQVISFVEACAQVKVRENTDAVATKYVVFHDACHTGRKRGLFEEPRVVLERIIGRPPDELTSCREDGICSGSGGLYPTSDPEGARSTAGHIRNFFPPGADDEDVTVVTTCPSARRGFERAGVNVAELAELVHGSGV